MERKQPDLVLIVARSFATKLATPTLIADSRGNLVFFNDAASEVIGRSYLDVGKLPASRWQELFEPRTFDEQPLRPEQTPSGIALLERRPVHGSFAFRGLDGREHEISYGLSALLAPGRGRRNHVDLLGASGDAVRVRVWGARGSLSAPGPATVGYGGNTSCVELELADGTTLILDAGSGIRELGQQLLQRDHGEVHICLTHLHLDHVEGLGFFGPLWKAGWKLRFWGPPSTTATLRERVSRYLSPPLFPVGLSEAPAEAILEDVPRKPWRIGSAVVEAHTVEHRGPTLGYRIEEEGRVLAYIPDHEPYLTAALDDDPEWISGWALAAGADLLLHDSQYTDEEYAHRLGWGHSSGTQAAAFARAAEVDRLALFHHDPMRSDRALDELYDEVAELLRSDQEPPLIAREGLEIELGAAP